LGQPSPALGGEPVFLQAAVGFVRNGAFDEIIGQHLTNALVQLAGGGLLADGCSDL